MSELRDANGMTESEFLANYREGDFPKPSVTADILLFSLEKPVPELLMIKRGGHPCLGMWALPGGFTNPDENVDAAAARELEEETGLNGLPMEPLALFSDPGRDPRTWVMTSAYLAVANRSELSVQADDDAQDAGWFQVHVSMTQDADDGRDSHYQKHGVEVKKMEFILTCEECQLSASIKLEYRIGSFSARPVVHLISSDGIAFDHGKIIATALVRLSEIFGEMRVFQER